jgi:hypothetical protein
LEALEEVLRKSLFEASILIALNVAVDDPAYFDKIRYFGMALAKGITV